MSNMSTLISATGVWQYIIFALYMAIMITVALVCRKKSKSVNEFLFANKGVGGWLTAFAYGATYFSAVIFVGYAGKFGWNFGLAAVWIGIGNAIFGTFVAWKVLAKRTKHMTNTLNARTMPDFFEKRYKSKHLKLVASLVIFVFLLPYSSSVYQGLGNIFEAVIGLNTTWCILILAVITALYLFMGGYFATSVSDFIQGIIMIVGVVVMVFMFISGDKVNWSEGFSTLTQNGLGIIPSTAIPAGKSFIDSSAFNIVIMVLLTSFGIWALPQSVHKFYAIKDDASIKRGTIISTLFALIVGGGAYLMGSLVTLFVDNDTFINILGGKTDRLVPMMITQNLPEALLGLIVVLLFSASMSTLAALSLSSSATVSIDFVKGYVKRDMPEKNTNILLRVLCLVFVGISAVLAILQIDAIVTMMSLSWGLLAGCFMGPYVLGLYSKKLNKFGAYASIISTFIITISMIVGLGIWQTGGGSFVAVLKAGISRSPLIGVVSMIMSLIVTPVFSYIFKDKNISEGFLSTIFAGKIDKQIQEKQKNR
ncbi:MAG: sodium:solute symporter family protein [Clostridia bacterium]|nr:sodium:solute symporter family protein [Clostridia bacterium]